MAWAIAKHNGTVMKDNNSRLLIYDSYNVAAKKLNELRQLPTEHLTIIDVSVVQVETLKTSCINV